MMSHRRRHPIVERLDKRLMLTGTVDVACGDSEIEIVAGRTEGTLEISVNVDVVPGSADIVSDQNIRAIHHRRK